MEFVLSNSDSKCIRFQRCICLPSFVLEKIDFSADRKKSVQFPSVSISCAFVHGIALDDNNLCVENITM